MQQLLPKISIKVNENVFIKDPDNSELGRKILTQGIELIDKIGFENFTFGKLSKIIKSSDFKEKGVTCPHSGLKNSGVSNA